MSAEARLRHPSAAAWRPDLRRMTARLAEELRREGAVWPELGAHVVAARAALRMRPSEFAAVLGVDDDILEALEAGRVAASDAPPTLWTVTDAWCGGVR